MLLFSFRFLALFALALATGVCFSHGLQAMPKTALPGPVFLAVQQILLKNYGPAMASVEIVSLVSLILVLVLVRKRILIFAATTFSWLCVTGMILVWLVFIHPINIQIGTWTPESLPQNWMLIRDRWAFLQGIRAVLSSVALAVLIVSVQVEKNNQ